MIDIFQVNTDDQLADLFTKPLGAELFHKFVLLTMGCYIMEAIASSEQGSVTKNDANKNPE